MKGLRKELLNLARANNRHLILIGKLVHTEDRDNVLQIFVTLENFLYHTRHVIVLLTHNARIKNRRTRIKRIDGRINSELCESARKHHRRIKVRECCRWRRVGKIVRRNIHRLHRSNRSLLSRSNTLLKLSHLLRQSRLISHRRRNASQKRRHFRPGLRKSENVVDKKKHIFSSLITKILRHSKRAQSHARSRSGGFVHLSEDQRRFIEHARVLHFMIEIVPFARTLPDSRKHTVSSVLLRDITNKFLNNNGLSHSRPSKKSDFSSFHERTNEVYRFNSRFKHFRFL